MDDLQVGAVIRSIRRRRGWRQVDVAAAARVGQSLVSLIERGQLEAVSLRALRRVAGALEIATPFTPRWRGGELPRLMDEGHAALVEQIVSLLRRRAWEVVVEYSFSYYGERGSVDVVAWWPDHRALLLVEVKTRLVDSQGLVAGLDRKTRVVPRLLAEERGWRAKHVGRIVYVAGTRANRAVVERFAETYTVAFADRARDARRWLLDPTGRLSAVWFVASSVVATGMRERATPARIRRSCHGANGMTSVPDSRLPTIHQEMAVGRSGRPRVDGIPPV